MSAVADSVNSGVGLAVNTVMAEKHRTFIATNVGTSDLTGKFCQPTTVQWTMDTYALGTTMARAMAARHDDTWYFISFDYALGAALERDSSAVLTSLGGKVLGFGQASARDHGFFVVFAPGPIVRRQGHGAGRYRNRPDQRGEAGGRIRHDAEAELSPACSPRSSTSIRSACRRPRA